MTSPKAGCGSRARVNSLWSVWYCGLSLALQLYLVAAAVGRFGAHAGLPWPRQPYLALNAYVACVGAAVVLLPCFALASLMRVGNLANDGTKLRPRTPPAVYQNVRAPRCRLLRALWKHAGPTAPFLHMCIALCLYAPRLILTAQLVKYGFLPKSEVWRNDLELLVPRRPVEVSFLATVNRTLAGQRWVSGGSAGEVEPDPPLCPEFVNYAAALVVYAARYPSVFWRVHKGFALLFSALLTVNAAQSLCLLSGFAVLHRLHVAGIAPARAPLLLGASTALLEFLAASVLILALGGLLYVYGVARLDQTRRRRAMRRTHVVWDNGNARREACMPQLLLFSALLALGLVSVPLAWDIKELYRRTLDGALLTILASTCLHLGVWLLAWLVLALKTRWNFQEIDPMPMQFQNEEVELSAGKETPLLVIENGHTFQVREKASKQAIIALAQETSTNHKPVAPSEDDDVYWLKPKPPSPKETSSPDTERLTWLKQHQRKSSGHKVTFDEAKNHSASRRKGSRSPRIGKKAHNVKFDELSDSDDGDYATLRDNLAQQAKPVQHHAKHGSDSSSGVHSLAGSVERRSADVVLHSSPGEPFGRATNVRLTSFTDGHQRRDSANFSLASSNESDNYAAHHLTPPSC